MTITKLDALISLVPTAEWVLNQGETIIWKDSKVTQPTDSAIMQKFQDYKLNMIQTHINVQDDLYIHL